MVALLKSLAFPFSFFSWESNIIDWLKSIPHVADVEERVKSKKNRLITAFIVVFLRKHVIQGQKRIVS
jgi:hypothetical protein